jgi:transcriptional regulator GlxA family with amidase domain
VHGRALGAEFARHNPAARVEIDPIFVRDGNLYNSAGIDLALALVEEDHGRDLALDVARYLVLFLKRSGGQAQFSTQLQAQFSAIPAIQKVQLWCQENPSVDLRVGALAKCAAMSERSFNHAFRDDTGQTPADFVTSVRLQAACRLLEETALAPKTVAKRCGLGSPAALRNWHTSTTTRPDRLKRRRYGRRGRCIAAEAGRGLAPKSVGAQRACAFVSATRLLRPIVCISSASLWSSLAMTSPKVRAGA